MPLILQTPEREKYEERIKRDIGSLRASQRLALMDMLGDPPSLDNVPAEFWEQAKEDEKDGLAVILVALFRDRARDVAEEHGLEIDETLVSMSADRFARERAAWTIERSQASIQNRLAAKIGAGKDLNEDEVSQSVEGNVGTIAVTETTQGLSTGVLFAAGAALEMNRRLLMIWRLSPCKHCALCPMLNMTIQDFWRRVIPAGPPVHPHCKCWLDAFMGTKQQAIAQGLVIAFEPPFGLVADAARKIGLFRL